MVTLIVLASVPSVILIFNVTDKFLHLDIQLVMVNNGWIPRTPIDNLNRTLPP